MTRPDTVQDVLALVRRSRLVDEAKLAGFLGQLHSVGLTPAGAPAAGAADQGESRLTPAGLLGLMVEQGLLTRYQADELAAGRWEFWVGGYRVLDRLGRGGMGTVFLAEHPLLG
ncbi:MAG TPA: hypothetical protein VKE74_10540, partial [Gemmataceae bacterium]|nr:hypothetical protein [Gemmataceae bacterium]